MVAKSRILVGVLFLPFLMQAQVNRLFSQMKDKYPDKTAVYLERNKSVDFYFSDDAIQVRSTRSDDLLFLSEKATALAQDKVYSSHLNELKTIEAKTLVPNKNRYTEVQVENFIEKDETSSGIFYDDSRSTSFVFPAVQPGARGILKYTSQVTDPRFLTSFYFGSFVPVERSELMIRAPMNVKLNFKLMNAEGYDIQHSRKTEGDHVIYTWTANGLKNLSYEADAPKLGYYAPHLVYFLEEYKLNNQTFSVLASIDDLFEMYSLFISNLNEEEDPTLRHIVDSLTLDIDDREEKVRNIFYWVQDHIKYIAFEDGMRGFVPHNASLVCDKRYGDCKDMASITQNMLQLAGIDAYLTWVGSRDLPYRYTEIPSPIVDNHMITAYEKDGEFVFLDATSKYTPLGFPSSMIQGKEALIAKSTNEFVIETVPVISKEQNQKIDSSQIRVSGDSILGQGRIQLTGYPKVTNSYRMRGLEKEGEKNYVTGLVSKGNNKFFVTDYDVAGFRDRDKPLIVDYQYVLKDYFKSIDDEIYINLSLTKTFFNKLIDTDKRTAPQENDYKYTSRQVAVFEIPEGYDLEYLPQDQKSERELFGFEINYQLEANKITQNKILYINYLILDLDQFQEWNQMIQELNEAYREVLVLKKKV